MSQRTIAVIGTAGRDKSIKMWMKHWDFMYQTLLSEVRPDDHLVSGGAAWADHTAVIAYLDSHVKHLTLHLPAPFNGSKYFQGEFGTSGAACNYYHGLFSHAVNDDTISQLHEAIAKGATVTTQPVRRGYKAMADRNALVARDCTHMLAFTFGNGDIPTDGGTKITWDMAVNKQRVHVPIPK